MAYAKIIFPANTHVLKKLKDIAKFCAGQVTSTSQFESATTSLSTVVTTEAAGWTLADSNSSFEATGTATKAEYRVKATCVVTSKTKFCAIKAFNAISSPTSATVSISSPTAVATTGRLITTIGTDTTGSALTNETFFIKTSNATNAGANWVVTDQSAVDLSATEFYVSCTNRKIIIVSSGTTNIISGVLEFEETRHTQAFSCLPVINFSSRLFTTNFSLGGTAGSPSIDTTNNTVSATGGSTSTGGSTTINQVCGLTNWYSKIDTLRMNRTHYDFFSNALLVQPPPELNTQDEYVYPLVELISVQTSAGEGIFNYSKLTDLYLTYRLSATVANGFEITVGADTYVIVTIGISTSPTDMRSLCIKKA